MGNNPSQAMATASFNNTMKDVNQQLGLGGEAKDETKTPAGVGCANKREQEQRHKDRQIEYEMKQKERMERKGALESKWASSASGKTSTADVVDEDKEKELKDKLAAMKQQYSSSSKDKKPKKSGFFGSKK